MHIYKDAIKYINELCRFGINLGLGRTKTLLKLLGSPDEEFYIIHVAGTNGKGSTSALLAAALENAGLKVGFYSSPHLHSYRERIKINGQNISQEDFALETKDLKNAIEAYGHLFPESPTEFEFLTILACSYFKNKEVDIAIFESGLGGKLDSTNALATNISIITNIGYDHAYILGDSIEKIADEKAGIIRRGGRLVIGLQEYEQAGKIIRERALFAESQIKEARDIVDKKDKVNLALKGNHQKENMLNALLTLEYLQEDFSIDEQVFLQGLSKAQWPGRLEMLAYQGREILIDGAHNGQAARALRLYLEQEFKDRKIFFLLSILDDKDKEDLLEPLWDLAQEIIVARAEGDRSQYWKELPDKFKDDPKLSFIEEAEEGLEEILARSGQEDLILSFGSFYFINKIREIILKAEGNYPERGIN